MKSRSDLQLKPEGHSGELDILPVSEILWMTHNISNSIWNSVMGSSGDWVFIFLTLDQSLSSKVWALVSDSFPVTASLFPPFHL